MVAIFLRWQKVFSGRSTATVEKRRNLNTYRHIRLSTVFFQIHNVIIFYFMENDCWKKSISFLNERTCWKYAFDRISFLYSFTLLYCSIYIFFFIVKVNRKIHIYYIKRIWIESNEKRCIQSTMIHCTHSTNKYNMKTLTYKQIHALILVQGNNLHIKRHYSVCLYVVDVKRQL